MTWKVSDLKGDDVLARDGSIGTLDDVYFDDDEWAVRYMVVDTGRWIPGRRVLHPPQAGEGGNSGPGKVGHGAAAGGAEGGAGGGGGKAGGGEGGNAEGKGFGPPYYWSHPVLWAA